MSIIEDEKVRNLSSSNGEVLCTGLPTTAGNLVTPGKFEISDSPARAPSCLCFDLSNNVDDNCMFGSMAEKAPGDPERLDSIVQTTLMGVCKGNATNAPGMPQR